MRYVVIFMLLVFIAVTTYVSHFQLKEDIDLLQANTKMWTNNIVPDSIKQDGFTYGTDVEWEDSEWSIRAAHEEPIGEYLGANDKLFIEFYKDEFTDETPERFKIDGQWHHRKRVFFYTDYHDQYRNAIRNEINIKKDIISSLNLKAA